MIRRRAPQQAPRVGRRKAVRPKRLGRALWLTLLAVLVPATLGLLLLGYLLRTHRPDLVRLVVQPGSLLLLAIALGVGWLLWMLLIWSTYLRTRPLSATLPTRMAGITVVVLLCGAVTAPMAVGARYAVVQRDLINTVFTGEQTITAPRVTGANPWGHRKRVNLLLLGGDGKVGRLGVRTDSMMLASVDVRTGSMIVFSLPRNLQRVPFAAGSKLAELYPDGFTDGSDENAEYFLNAVYRNVPALHPGVLGRSDNEGADAIKLAVSGALGIPVDYYLLVNLDGFREIVDAIGGITVNLNERVPIGGNTDAHILPDAWMEPGPDQRLDGFHALWFSRGRYGSTDYKRMQRQRCALNAIVEEADPVTLLRHYTALATAGKRLVRTDIPQELLPAFVDLAQRMKGEPLGTVGFERTSEFDPNDPDYAYVQRTVSAAFAPAARTAPAPPPTSRDAHDAPDADPAGSADLSGTPGGSAQTGSMTDASADCAYHPVDDSVTATEGEGTVTASGE